MPKLGKVNFKNVTNNYPVISVPKGELLDVEGVTKTWEPVDNTNDEGVHALGKFGVNHEIEGRERNIELRIRWAVTNTDGLWRTQRDCIALGTDPTEFVQESDSDEGADMDSIFNEIFSSPKKVVLTIKETTFTPRGYDANDPTSPQPRQQNDVVAVRLA